MREKKDVSRPSPKKNPIGKGSCRRGREKNGHAVLLLGGKRPSCSLFASIKGKNILAVLGGETSRKHQHQFSDERKKRRGGEPRTSKDVFSQIKKKKKKKTRQEKKERCTQRVA